jgi:glycosyltransferase 2 family protein
MYGAARIAKGPYGSGGKKLSDRPKVAVSVRRLMIMALKAAISGCLILLLIHKLDFLTLLSQAQKLNAPVIAGVLVIVIIQTWVIAGLRLQLVLATIGARLPFGSAAKIAISGLFVEQVAFGFAGGDATRLWLLGRTHVLFAQSLMGLFIDRVIGLGSLILLCLIGIDTILMLFGHVGRQTGIVILSLSLGLLCVGLAFVLGYHKRLLAKLSAYRRHLNATAPRRRVFICLGSVFGLAVAIHLLNVVVIWLPAKSLGLPLSFAQCLFIVPSVLLVSMLPISSGGWGIREGLMVIAFGQLGIEPEQAIVPSLLFGATTLVATLPGSIIWVLVRKSTPQDANTLAARDLTAIDGGSGPMTQADQYGVVERPRDRPPSATTRGYTMIEAQPPMGNSGRRSLILPRNVW